MPPAIMAMASAAATAITHSTGAKGEELTEHLC